MSWRFLRSKEQIEKVKQSRQASTKEIFSFVSQFLVLVLLRKSQLLTEIFHQFS